MFAPKHDDYQTNDVEDAKTVLQKYLTEGDYHEPFAVWVQVDDWPQVLLMGFTGEVLVSTNPIIPKDIRAQAGGEVLP